MKKVFITGTDTGVGKTVVTAGLLKAAHRAKLSALGLKPIQTGCYLNGDGSLFAPDVKIYREACAEVRAEALVCLRPACSPHLALKMEGRKLKVRDMASLIHNYLSDKRGEILLMEGAGGVMVPLNEKETMLDLMAALGGKALLVVANRLGAVNHALLSFRALHEAGLEVAGFVLTGASPCENTGSAGGARPSVEEGFFPDKDILFDNRHIIEALSGCPCLGELPCLDGLNVVTPEKRRQAWKEAALLLAPTLKVLSGV